MLDTHGIMEWLRLITGASYVDVAGALPYYTRGPVYRPVMSLSNLHSTVDRATLCAQKEVEMKHAHNWIDMTGQRYGKLVCLRPVGKQQKNTLWWCVCDCGKEMAAKGGNLRNGNTKCCGCVRSERTIARNIEGANNGEQALYVTYQQRADLFKREFTLPFDQFIHITSSVCHYCGCVPSMVKKRYHGNYIYNGIDRVDSKSGYIEGNCVPCCAKCNHAKKDMSYQEFIDWLSRIAQYINERQAEYIPMIEQRLGVLAIGAAV
jgi:hypothetical protein